jgi:hypothetical protein
MLYSQANICDSTWLPRTWTCPNLCNPTQRSLETAEDDSGCLLSDLATRFEPSTSQEPVDGRGVDGHTLSWDIGEKTLHQHKLTRCHLTVHNIQYQIPGAGGDIFEATCPFHTPDLLVYKYKSRGRLVVSADPEEGRPDGETSQWGIAASHFQPLAPKFGAIDRNKKGKNSLNYNKKESGKGPGDGL